MSIKKRRKRDEFIRGHLKPRVLDIGVRMGR